jgi:DNA-binding transcriptional regulator YiaG
VDGEAAQEWRSRWAGVIRTQRTAVLGMTQHQFADYLGTSQSTVGMWEAGQSVPSDLMKIRVIALAGVDAREMFRPLDADPIRRHDQ